MSAWAMLTGYILFVLLQDIFQPPSLKGLFKKTLLSHSPVNEENGTNLSNGENKSTSLKWQVIVVFTMLLFGLPALCVTVFSLVGRLSSFFLYVLHVCVCWLLLTPAYNWTKGERLYRALCANNIDLAEDIIGSGKHTSLSNIINKGIQLITFNIENGVICPLFYMGLFGAPIMLSYIILYNIVDYLEENNCHNTIISKVYRAATFVVMYPFTFSVFIATKYMFPNNRKAIQVNKICRKRISIFPLPMTTLSLCITSLYEYSNQDKREAYFSEKEDIIRVNDLLFLSSTLLVLMLLIFRLFFGVGIAVLFIAILLLLYIFLVSLKK